MGTRLLARGFAPGHQSVLIKYMLDVVLLVAQSATRLGEPRQDAGTSPRNIPPPVRTDTVNPRCPSRLALYQIKNCTSHVKKVYHELRL